MSSGGRIFISYRRDTGSSLARLVEQELRRRGYRVFLDVEDLQSGRFNVALIEEISRATDVVVILTKGCLDRCKNDGDWLRQEISHAIQCGTNIVPLMRDGFAFPEEPLPAEMEEIRNFHGIEFSHNDFSSSMNRLVSLLKGKRTRRKMPILVTAGVLVLLGGSFALARLLPATEESSVHSKGADLVASITPNANPLRPDVPPPVTPSPEEAIASSAIQTSNPAPAPEKTDNGLQAKRDKEDVKLSSELVSALRSDVKSDFPKGLQLAIEVAGDRTREEIPDLILGRIELVALKMALAGSWESDIDIDVLRKISGPPFNSGIAPLVLANERLQLADLLIAEERISDANERLQEGFALLDEGIARESELCQLKKGSLLTRHYYFKYKNTPGLEIPGDSVMGLELLEDAYASFRAKHLDKNYFAPAEFVLPFDDALCEANAALVIAQCWHHGIGTGKPEAYDAADSFEGKQSGKKAIEYYQKVLDLDFANGEARAGLLEMLINLNESYWTDDMIEVAKSGADLDDGYCMYHYANHLWTQKKPESKEEARSLMRRAAAPGGKMTTAARAWLEQHPEE